jgi:hypothetical protein
MKMLVVSIGVALAQWGAGPAFADSAVGVDMANGNALNPPGRSAVPRPMVDEGIDTVRRSPTGQLYGAPYEVASESSKTESGWDYSGGIEVGVLGGDAALKNSLFRKYKDLSNGAYLNYFEVEADKAGNANYMSAFGGGAGKNDQFYGMQVGRYNDWKLKLFYNETMHVFTDNWKSLFNGEGTGNLTTGLPVPTAYVDALTHTGGSVASGKTFVGNTAAWACTADAPCWQYGSKIYANAIGTTGTLANQQAAAVAAVNGISGTANATSGLIAGVQSSQSNMALAINNKLSTVPDSELSLVRQKVGARMDKTITDNWKSYLSYTQEARKGERPFAMNEGNISTEIAEPIDYTTHDFLAGVQYADKLTQANLRASMSFFRNNISTLNVQYPFQMAATTVGGLQTATYDLYPDNNAFNLKGEFARSLPNFFNGRFNAALSWGTSQQNDDLLAPISAAQLADLQRNSITQFGTGTTGIANAGYPTGSSQVANWSTTAALSQPTGKQRIDNTLLDLGLSVKPTDALSMKGTYRLYDSANKGGYMAYNPLTGQFGRGPADGNGSVSDYVVALQPGTTNTCYVPPGYPAISVPGCIFGYSTAAGGAANVVSGSNAPVFGQARSTKQTNYGLSGDYDLTQTSSASAAIEREEFYRNFRERENTWENKLKFGYVNRALGNTSLRASYEVDSKRGGEYRYRTFEDLGTGLPGLDVATQAAQAGITTAGSPRYAALAAGLFNRYSYYFRKYDQANRDQDIFNARLNVLARDDMDVGVVLQLKNIKYPDSFYGLEKDNLNSLTLDFNYQPTSNSSFYGFYSYQQGNKAMNMNSVVASATNTACTAANLATYGYSACSDYAGDPNNGTRPLSSAWVMESDDRNNVLGLGFQSSIGTVRFGVDYTYASSATNISYTYGSTALSNVAATQAAAALIAGSALPSMTFVQQTLNFNVLIPVNKRTSVRLYDRVELGGVTDWHYDGVVKNAVANYDSGTLLLDSGPQNYRANVIGVFIQYKL